jgi:crotonobetaine/carnitine-CoA ligase
MTYRDRVLPEQRALSYQLRVAATERPRNPFLIDRERTYTFEDVDRYASARARELMSLGLSPGDSVAILAYPSVRAHIVDLALGRTRTTSILVNTAHAGDLLARVLGETGAVAVATDPVFVDELCSLRAKLPQLRNVVLLQEDSGAAEGAAHAGYEVHVLRDIELGDDDWSDFPDSTELACVSYTSGTTGASKGVMLSYRHELSFALTYAASMQLVETDVAYNHLPMFHLSSRCVMGAAVLSRSAVYVSPRLSISNFWQDVADYGVTTLFSVGGVAEMLYEAPFHPLETANSLRAVRSVPGVRDPRAFMDRFGCKVSTHYGQTETSVVAETQLGEDAPSAAMGRVIDLFEVRVANGRDEPVPVGTPGELLVRSREPWTTMLGYYGMPEATLKLGRNQWWHSGDLVRIDEAGYLYFLDRSNDAIRYRGENVSSFEVESAAAQHDSVLECAAVGVPSPTVDQDVKLIVVPAPQGALAAEELFEFLVGQLPYFALPRYIALRDQLPKTSTGKIKKLELREDTDEEVLWDREKHGYRVNSRGVTREEGAR